MTDKSSVENSYKKLKRIYSENIILAHTVLGQIDSIRDSSQRSHVASVVRNALNEAQKTANLLAEVEATLNINYQITENEARSAVKTKLDRINHSNIADNM